MADLRKHANTSNLVRFTLKHASTGQGLTGLTSGSSGLIISTITDNEATATTYTVAGSTIETITTLGTFAAPTATKCRFREVDATAHKGLYEFQFADARFAIASARRLIISVTGAANLLDADYEIQLVQFDPYDAVRLGLTALPNAAAEAAGGLYTRGTGAGQINQAANGMIDTNSVRLNNVSQSLLDLKDFADDGYDPSTNKVQGVVLTDTVTTYTGNTPQTGDVFPLASTEIADIKAKTDNLPTDPADQSLLIAATDAIMTRLGVAGAGLTALGDTRLANLDATVSSRASQASADDLPTNAELATALGTSDDATLAAIAALNNLSAAQVNAEVDTALTDYDAPTFTELDARTDAIDATLATIAGYLDTEVAAIKVKTDFLPSVTAGGAGGLFIAGTNAATTITTSLTTTFTGNLTGSVASVTAGVTLAASAVQAIWDAATSALTTAGSIGKRIADFLTGDAFARLGAPAGASVSADIAAIDTPTTQEIVDAVLDEPLASHADAGSVGEGISNASSAGDPWATALPGSYNAGEAGKIVGDSLNATVGSRASQTSVDDVPTNAELATALGTADDAVLAQVALVKTKTDQLTFTAANKVDSTFQAAGDFPQAAADKVWSTTTRTLSAFGFSVTVGTNNDKTGYALSSAGIQAIWDALTSALTAVGSIGKLLVDNLNATMGSRASQTSVDDLPTNAELATALGTADDATLAQVALVKAKTDLIPGSPAAVGSAMTLTSGERDAIANALLDLAAAIDGDTVRRALQIIAAAAAGERSGAGSGTESFLGLDGATERLTGDVDDAGNRSNVSYP